MSPDLAHSYISEHYPTYQTTQDSVIPSLNDKLYLSNFCALICLASKLKEKCCHMKTKLSHFMDTFQFHFQFVPTDYASISIKSDTPEVSRLLRRVPASRRLRLGWSAPKGLFSLIRARALHVVSSTSCTPTLRANHAR